MLLTQKTQERIVWGEPVSVLSSQGHVGPRAEEEEAESTLSAAEWLRFIQQLLLLRLAARTAGTGHLEMCCRINDYSS